MLAGAALVLAGCGSPSSYSAATVPQAKQLMVDYLGSKHLTYHWVACLHSGRSFNGAAIVSPRSMLLRVS